MGAAQRVLVVDGLSETEEVLRAVLEPRGLQVDRVRGGFVAKGAGSRRPSVVVLHVEEPLAAAAPQSWPDVPRILIGATRESGAAEPASGDQHFEKPFHYGELIRAIEQVLARQAL